MDVPEQPGQSGDQPDPSSRFAGHRFARPSPRRNTKTTRCRWRKAQQIVDFLRATTPVGDSPMKETTIGFYAWMKREVKALYAKFLPARL